ncbi:YceD family protein [Sagittula salina]|uniref:DUF177 domain-containing protein n=1 Tax=Sagittula salina TaxID=2820268 RepID=A0A940MJJ7_9RHOB|nr:DUF177 domain-containing protein [Sagittula salina]MBP0482965.1 DUF177 domain-containing protein [Sagittula salina]
MPQHDAPRPTAETRLRVSALRQSGETPFLLEPDAQARADLAAGLDIEAVKKLRFEGRIVPRGRNAWELTAKLGATVVQSCIVTLEPVTTRIDAPIIRRYVPASQLAEPEEGSEIEVPEDDSLEPLGEVIDLQTLMHEELALALPAYPRKEGVALDDAQFAADGVAPMTDDDVRPFAGLAALKEKMEKGDGES